MELKEGKEGRGPRDKREEGRGGGEEPERGGERGEGIDAAALNSLFGPGLAGAWPGVLGRWAFSQVWVRCDCDDAFTLSVYH